MVDFGFFRLHREVKIWLARVWPFIIDVSAYASVSFWGQGVTEAMLD